MVCRWERNGRFGVLVLFVSVGLVFRMVLEFCLDLSGSRKGWFGKWEVSGGLEFGFWKVKVKFGCLVEF